MAISPLIPLVGFLLVFVGLGVVGFVGVMVRSFLLLVLFLFAQVAIDVGQGTFYSIMALGGILFPLAGFAIMRTVGLELFGNKLKGGVGFVAVLGLGAVLTVLVRSLAGPGNAASVIGVPSTLAVSSEFINFLSPTLVSSLGYIENLFFFGLLQVTFLLLTFGPLARLLAPVLQLAGMVLVSGAFALFHLAVFQISGLIFAFFAFLIFVVSMRFFGPEPANVAHYVHNGIESLPRTLAVVG